MNNSIVFGHVVATCEEFLAWSAKKTLVEVVAEALLEGHLTVLASVERFEDSLDGEAQEGFLGC